ncbi:MAG: pilus assembly protein TadG-related protein, partial [Chloroflexota bacterium]
MPKVNLMRRLTRSLKRHQTGQAIIIIAVGFIILLGFVGIVTDVSLLYIRYAALRRAVDSAAVAAAGQVRTDRAATAPKLAAIQFLEFHGITTDNVFVETCQDMPPDWANPDWRLDSATEEQQQNAALYDEVCQDQRKLVRVTAFIESPTVFMSIPPFNFDTITLSASAISETASLDVVVVLDVSESMLFETTADTWDNEIFGGGTSGDRWSRWLPQRFHTGWNWYRDQGGTLSEEELQDLFLRNYTDGQHLQALNGGGLFPFDTDAVGVSLNFTPLEYYMNDSGNVVTVASPNLSPMWEDKYQIETRFSPQARPAFVHSQRAECTVRILPPAYVKGISGNIDSADNAFNVTLLDQYEQLGNGYGSDVNGAFNDYYRWEGGLYNMFVPNVDFYGCCNDPTLGSTVDLNGNITADPTVANFNEGDFDFSDLVCQPFKEARDATRLFIQNIDFSRGDRVAFVTFDRAAYLVDPDGYDYNYLDPDDGTTVLNLGGGTRTHMIDDFNVALEVLNRNIGVRAEPNFYYTDNNAGASVFGGVGQKPVDIWENYSVGARTVQADVNRDGEFEDDEFVVVPIAIDSAYFSNAVGTLRSGYHTRDSCPPLNAALPGDYSV